MARQQTLSARISGYRKNRRTVEGNEMSLTREQRASTIREFAENMDRLGVTADDVAVALGGTPAYAQQVVNLRARNLEDPWVVRNWLLRIAAERGVALLPFTALAGDHHDYWFLDGPYIDRGRIG